MIRRLRYMIIALTLAIAILGASSINLMSLSQFKLDDALKPQVIDLQSLLNKGLDNGEPNFKYSVLAQTSSGEAKLMSLTDFQKHYHEHENHFFYILKGQANLQIGLLKTRIKQGDFVIIPAGKKYEHELKAIGDQPLQVLAFVTPLEQ